jgi:adenylyltransferase/sulfurtransferase
MMHSIANPIKATLSGDTVSKISELPLVGNQLLQTQVPQMSVQQLKQLLDQDASNLLLIDVRFPSEYKIAGLPGWVIVPYPEIQSGQGIATIKQLLQDKCQSNPGHEPHLIVMCKAGVRSAKTVALLKSAGIDATNVTGGIQAWSEQIDPSIPQYSMNNISEYQPTLAKHNKNKKRWLIGGGVAVALGTVGAFFAVRHDSDILIPIVRAGVPLEWASPYSHTLASVNERAALPYISVQQLKQLIDSKASDYVLVDVRTPKEFQLSHIPGATLVAADDMEQAAFINKIQSLLKGKQGSQTPRLIVYCTSGHRSATALVKLKQAGIKGIQVKGGIKAWTQEINPSLPRNNW